jgi:putative ABC transport system permease protein
MVARDAMLLLAIGTVTGASIALASARFMSALVFGISTRDPLTYVTVIALLGAAVFAATFLPARRVSLTDPATVLRQP